MKSCHKLLMCLLFTTACTFSQQPLLRFAVIGDYGKWTTGGEALVSNMIHQWNPELILTAGDNNYEHGSDSTIDSNIGQFYHDYIYPYNGIFGSGAPFNKFFPSLGNHDYLTNNAAPYLAYFTLPGNERYYSFTRGNCEFFAVNSNPEEPDGFDSNSVQANWLKAGLQSSNARFKIVYFHHPPFSSGMHGNTLYMDWPFKRWGASVVLSGHEHNYERLVVNGMTYFVNGLGGKDWRDLGIILPESRKTFTGNFGAMLISAYTDSINFKFIAVPDSVKDDTTIVLPPIGIIKITETAESFSLKQNHPNPFNPSTNIEFSLPEKTNIRLTVFDILGREITRLADEILPAGNYKVLFKAENLPSGVYFYKIETEKFTVTKKMLLIK